MSSRNVVVLLVPLLTAVGMTVASYLFFPQDVMFDDAAFTLKYVDNLNSGHGYRFNASDPEPVYGSSSFLFTIVVCALKNLGIESNFLYARLPGLLGYFAVLILGFHLLYRMGGLLLGIFGIISLACVPQYFVVADSGLETMFAGALLCAALYLFYFQIHIGWLMFVCAAMTLTKLDLLAASETLVLAQLIISLRAGREQARAFVRQACVFHVIPVALFCIFLVWYFGSILPNSLQAKLIFLKHAGGYKYFHYFFESRNSYLPVFIAAVISAGLITATAILEKSLPSFRILAIWIVAIALLVQVWVTPFLEVFPWYFVVPLLALQFAALFSIGESRALSRSVITKVLCGVSCILVLVTIVFPSVWGLRTSFWKDANGGRLWLEVIERERRALGQWVARQGSPQDLLSTGYGWSAYDSKMKVFDHFGINTRQPVLENWGMAGWLDKLEDTKPKFIICHKATHPLLARGYDLIAVDWTPRIGGHSEWEVYRRKENPLLFDKVSFPNLTQATLSSREGDGKHSFKCVTDSDYMVLPDPTGAAITIGDLDFSHSIVGVYCYLDEVDPPATEQAYVTLEAETAGQAAAQESYTVNSTSPVLLTLKVPWENTKGTLKIFCRASEPNRSPIHVRDVFVTKGSH
jgi:hypothetical protein